MEFVSSTIAIQPVHESLLSQYHIHLSIARLDSIHAVVSGNKYFKLKHYLQSAYQQNKSELLTFGGFYSNHIAATAYVAKHAGIKATGIIKGNRPQILPHTLQAAQQQGMQLQFVSNAEYNLAKRSAQSSNKTGITIPEGGYGPQGALGVTEMMLQIPAIHQYDYIVAAVGTGTTLAGIVNAVSPSQQVIGVSSMKNNASLEEEVRQLVDCKGVPENWAINHNYHFGGYAKKTPELLAFMNQFYQQHQIPLDFVYTAKMMYAVYDGISSGYFKPFSSVLAIHSGGLQGNLSLPGNALVY